MRRRQTTQKGFTLMEMLVAVSLFSIVSVIVAGSILSLIGSNTQTQAEQQALTALSFSLDNMTREIRTGFNYFCHNGPFDSSPTNLGAMASTEKRDCINSANGIAFRESSRRLTTGCTGEGQDRVAFYYDSVNQTIMRKVCSRNAEPITPSNVRITNLQFFVTGTPQLNEVGRNTLQPTVTVVVSALWPDVPNASTTIQTTVTQRILDI